MATISLDGVTIPVGDDINLAERVSELFKDLQAEIKTQYSPEVYTKVDNSAAYLTLQDSIFELIKNSIDAGATKLNIHIGNIDIASNTISFKAIDDGRGFPQNKLGNYSTTKESVGVSDKLTDTSKKQLGGAHIGLLQASVALSRNDGSLYCENVSDPGVTGARLIFSSSLNECRYRISDYQIERESESERKAKISGTAVNQFLGAGFAAKLAAARKQKAASLETGSTADSFGSAASTTVMRADSASTDLTSRPDSTPPEPSEASPRKTPR